MSQFPDEQSESGEFKRQEDAFRDWVKRDGSTHYKPARDRYHLYVSLACPWAHRTIILRKLKGLEATIGMTVVDPVRDERGWAFRDGPGHREDSVNGFQFLSEAYHATDPDYRGRVTVPVLWDKETKHIVSNSDDDLLRMFNTEFSEFATNDYDFYPPISAPRSTRSTSAFTSGSTTAFTAPALPPRSVRTNAPRQDYSRRLTNSMRASPRNATC